MTVQVTLTFATLEALKTFLAGNAPTTAAPVAPTPSTRYFHDAAHRTVYQIEPGQVVPSVPGAVEIDAANFSSLKATYSAPPPVAAPTSPPAAAPAPAAVGVDDMFGGPAATAPMTAQQFSEGLKAKCDPATNPGARAKLTAFLGKKGAATVGALVAGKSEVELGALFVEAAAALV